MTVPDLGLFYGVPWDYASVKRPTRSSN